MRDSVFPRVRMTPVHSFPCSLGPGLSEPTQANQPTNFRNSVSPSNVHPLGSGSCEPTQVNRPRSIPRGPGLCESCKWTSPVKRPTKRTETPLPLLSRSSEMPLFLYLKEFLFFQHLPKFKTKHHRSIHNIRLQMIIDN